MLFFFTLGKDQNLETVIANFAVYSKLKYQRPCHFENTSFSLVRSLKSSNLLKKGKKEGKNAILCVTEEYSVKIEEEEKYTASVQRLCSIEDNT